MYYVEDEKQRDSYMGYFELAAEEALKSFCRKSYRGAVLIKKEQVIGRGYILPTIFDHCDPCIRENIRDNSRQELCSAIHAEQMAVMHALQRGEKRLSGALMVHVKVKNGVIVPSGKPSCTICSRLIQFYDIHVALLHKKGIAIYEPDEFNKLSFEYFLKQ
jgi:deoxycytidylate deaminase